MKVGILGGGQLAQMMAQAGNELGMTFTFLCPDAPGLRGTIRSASLRAV